MENKSTLEQHLKTRGIRSFLENHPRMEIYLIQDANPPYGIAGASFDRASANIRRNKLNAHITHSDYILRPIPAQDVLNPAQYDDQQQQHILSYLAALPFPRPTSPSK